MPTFPQWIDPTEGVNLRAVAPGLFVGGARAPRLSPPNGRRWELIVDLCGSSANPDYATWYEKTPGLVRMPFEDGEEFPTGTLDVIGRLVSVIDGPCLLHCAAGLSRSASAAYAVLRVGGLDHKEALLRVKVVPQFPVPTTLKSARAWAERRLAPHDARR